VKESPFQGLGANDAIILARRLRIKAMNRRNFLSAVTPLALPSALTGHLPLATRASRPALRLKVTDVRILPLKTVQEVGSIEPAWNPGGRMTFELVGAQSQRFTPTRA
jgi:hypothetical protein